MPLVADMKQGLRSLRRNLPSGAVALLTLSLVLGVSTCVYAILDAVVLQPFPYQKVDQLAVVWGAPSFDARPAIDGTTFQDWGRQAPIVAGTSVFQLTPVRALLGDSNENSVDAFTVGTELFNVLGAEALMGRVFSSADDSNPSVVVISYGLWQQRFSGDASIVGKSISINGQPHAVVGVMRRGFFFPDTNSQLWLPLASGSTAFRQVQGIARLRDAPSVRQIATQLDSVLRPPGLSVWRGVGVFPLRRLVMLDYDKATWILFAATMLLVLAACGNVAMVLLADRIDRRDDLLIRQSLGASRQQLIALLVVEPAILSTCAAGIGVMVASVTMWALRLFDLSMVPRLELATVDGRAFGFAVCLSVLCTVVCGLIPALSYESNIAALLSGAHTVVGRRSVAKELIIVLQVGATGALLFSAVILTVSFVTRVRSNWGFHPEDVLVAEISLPRGDARAPLARVEMIREILDEMGRAVGASNVAITSGVPIKWNQWTIFVPLRDGQPFTGSTASQWVISDRYFSVMGIPIIEGRDFSEHDVHSRHVVISQRLARALWNEQSAVGKYLGKGKQFAASTPNQNSGHAQWVLEGEPWQVIGVAGDVRMFGLESQPPPAVYVQYMEDKSTELARVFAVFHLSGQALGSVSSIREVIGRIAPSWRVSGLYWMGDLVRQSVGGRGLPKLLSLVSTSIGLLAALVMCLGVFGVMSFNVKTMTRSLAVRRALGCSPKHIALVVMRDTWIALGGGVALGLVAVVALSYLLRPFLFGITSTDWRVLVAVAFSVLATGLIGTVLPTVRALRVMPATALRDS